MWKFLSALVGAALSLPVGGATFVYVSNAEDGDIGMYTLRADGALQPGQRFKADKMVMPMAVSPDKRFLVAVVRTKPFSAYTYTIDRTSGALQHIGSGPLAESFPYITFDKTGRYLLSASYGAHLVSVNPVSSDGRIGDPMQVIPTARNAHAIINDKTNRYVFVPHLGTDQIFQFVFDAKNGRVRWRWISAILRLIRSKRSWVRSKRRSSSRSAPPNWSSVARVQEDIRTHRTLQRAFRQ